MPSTAGTDAFVRAAVKAEGAHRGRRLAPHRRRPRLDVRRVDLLENLLDACRRAPLRVVGAELVEIADPPAVIADARLGRELPVELAAGDPLAELDRLAHRAVAEAA